MMEPQNQFHQQPESQEPNYQSPEPEPQNFEPPQQDASPEGQNQKPARNKKLIVLIAVLAVVVLGLGTWYAAGHFGAGKPVSHNLQDPDNDFDNSAFTTEATVTISDNNFVPASILIKPHTRLNIENKDDVSHWITLTNPKQADGPATSEDNDPSLPQNLEISAGGGYAHVFEKADTYALHLTDQSSANLSVVVK